ncbi:MAG: SDR family oxidoreductase [Solirubrobacteraceae bacterium]|jgi:NAD(P)-dependent dehydrogenase (short-subunit alcohol dehydrogenase family)|nr:SDR family oxidoreductase [Solirubrobacteraceae bacterium]
MDATTSEGRAAVVTGGARGFGFEIARALLDRGYSVVITDLDPAAVAAAAERLGAGARGIAADARDPESHRAAAAAATEYGPLRVWVNNAGVAYAGKVWDLSDEEVERTVRVNVLGVLHGSRVAVEQMRGGGGGHILNIASMSAFGPVPGLGVYAATKAAVKSITTSLQGDLDEAGIPIRAHALCPDAADTQMVRDVEDDPEAALLFSGFGLLGAEKVADAAVDLLDGNRIVKSMPGYRALLIRTSDLVPTAGLKTLHLFRRLGERRQRSRA